MSTGINVNDELWEQRRRTRWHCYERLKYNPKFLRMRKQVPESELPKLPDPDDRTLSKRQWEKLAMQFRKDVLNRQLFQ